MAYVNPKDARAPRGKWRLEDVLIDQGESPPDGGPARFSVAIGYWQEIPCLAVRWNGYEGPGKTSGVGYPQTIGHAIWFILPTDFNRLILPLIPPEKQSIVKMFLSINENTNIPEANRVAFPPRHQQGSGR